MAPLEVYAGQTARETIIKNGANVKYGELRKFGTKNTLFVQFHHGIIAVDKIINVEIITGCVRCTSRSHCKSQFSTQVSGDTQVASIKYLQSQKESGSGFLWDVK